MELFIFLKKYDPSATLGISNAQKLETMTALFIIAIAVFGYMCYVLLKPE